MFLTILSCDKLGTFIACFDVFTHYWPAKSSSATLTEFVWCFLWRSSVISVCLRSLGSNSDNNIWAKVMYLNKCIRLNVIFREPSLLNLCTVHSLRGRMLMAFCFCSLHLVLIKCCESKSMCCNCLFLYGAILIDPLQKALHVLNYNLYPVMESSEGQVLLCVALMNHYFCTCFVHLIKRTCFAPVICLVTLVPCMQTEKVTISRWSFSHSGCS